MQPINRLLTVGFLLLVVLLFAACGKDDGPLEDQSLALVGTCESNPVDNLDCECFNTVAESSEYVGLGGKLNDIAQATVADIAADPVAFDQNEINAMLALTDELEGSCITQR